MLFAFVACNPDSSSSSSSQEDEPLPNEVTPPAESERKSMSDAEIVEGVKYYELFCSNKSKITEVVRDRETLYDYGENGTLSIKYDEDWKDSLKVGDSVETVTANGKMMIENDSYAVDNLVLVGRIKADPSHGGDYDYTIEKGSVTKNETKMTKEEVCDFLLNNTSKFKDSNLKAYTDEETKKTTMKVIDEKGITIGIGTEIEKDTSINDEEKSVWVYDFTVNGSRIQCKIRYSEKEGGSIDYFALDGVFFDKASCEKLMDLIY